MYGQWAMDLPLYIGIDGRPCRNGGGNSKAGESARRKGVLGGGGVVVPETNSNHNILIKLVYKQAFIPATRTLKP